MSDKTRLLELIDDFSVCVMRFVYMEDYFQNYQKTDNFAKLSDQARQELIDGAKETHPRLLRPIRANVQDRAEQLAAELENAGSDCTDVLELSNLIGARGVDLMAVRLKWARVEAQLTQKKYKASPTKNTMTRSLVGEDLFEFTADYLREVALNKKEKPLSETSFRNARTYLGLGKGVAGNLLPPKIWRPIANRRIEISRDRVERDHWKDLLDDHDQHMSRQKKKT